MVFILLERNIFQISTGRKERESGPLNPTVQASRLCVMLLILMDLARICQLGGNFSLQLNLKFSMNHIPSKYHCR
jgi:hypothetical protein